MATNKREKQEKFTTPRGVLGHPWVQTPDTKFSDDGRYSTKLSLAPDKAAPLMEQIDAQIDLSLAKAKQENPNKKNIKRIDAPYKVDEDTGNVVFSFSAKASGTIKKGPKAGQTWERKVALFDAKGKPLSKKVRVGSGTEAKVSFEFNQYYVPKDGAGVSLRLCAVQVLNLVEWTGNGGSADQFGFGEEEGYEFQSTDADEDAEDASPAKGDDEGGDGDDSDF